VGILAVVGWRFFNLLVFFFFLLEILKKKKGQRWEK
jgi:hypothetical protein